MALISRFWVWGWGKAGEELMTNDYCLVLITTPFCRFYVGDRYHLHWYKGNQAFPKIVNF
ncbi:asr3783 [Nostoc sp. PCC 7120 = FACHB-418]|nr:asr3783 [Nostoc sp. PCC 7120 = FACHB-418]